MPRDLLTKCYAMWWRLGLPRNGIGEGASNGISRIIDEITQTEAGHRPHSFREGEDSTGLSDEVLALTLYRDIRILGHTAQAFRSPGR